MRRPALTALLALSLASACSSSEPEFVAEAGSMEEPVDGSAVDPSTPALDPASLEVLGAEIHVEWAGSDEGPLVILLHGAAFTSADWFDLGIAQGLADAGLWVAAIDLPGRGESDSIDPDDEAAFLPALVDVLGVDPSSVVIVSPSMSGIFSLPALRAAAFADLGGYVSVAPSGGSSFAEDGPVLDIPALVIRGDGDGEDPAAIAQNLASAFTDAEVWIVPDAGHSAYVDAPDEFVARVAAFADTVYQYSS